MTIRSSLQGLNTQYPDLKYLAQKSVICFLKSQYRLQRNKDQLLDKINLKELALSHGLMQTPRISFNSSDMDTTKKNFMDKESDMIEEEEDSPLKGNRKSRKLDKLKRKIALKKQMKNKTSKCEIEDKYLIKNMDSQLNELRRNPLMKRGLDILEYEETKVEDFLIPKKKEDQEEIKDLDIRNMKVSKRRLKRVRVDGTFGGKNILNIDQEGNLVDRETAFKKEFADPGLKAKGVDRVGLFKSKLGTNIHL